MKSLYLYLWIFANVSHPARGAWIEILGFPIACCIALSHPARGAWIEIAVRKGDYDYVYQSHPARGAWIEMYKAVNEIGGTRVAPRKGCVD